MEVRVLSKEFIKPSSRTPYRLKTHKLSLLDQFISPTYVPIVLFYPRTNTTPIETVALLKTSLSQTLTHFYPFAGTIKDGLSINCNDEGVPFFEARANFDLSQFLNRPDLGLIHTFLPATASWSGGAARDHVAMAQATTFVCGGVAVGVLVSHAVADGISLSTFLKSWASTARKSAKVVCPYLDAWTIFPSYGRIPRESTLATLLVPFCKSGWCNMKRFVFNASSIARLKAEAGSSELQNPTRVEAVSALLIKRIMATLDLKSGSCKPMSAIHAVNLRRRASPALPEYYMGNYLFPANVLCAAAEDQGENETTLPSLASKLREAIGKIDADFVENLQGEGRVIKLREAVGKIARPLFTDDGLPSKGLEQLYFSSWCNFGLYEIDFGWGKPIWVTLVGSGKSELALYMNVIVLVDTRLGDGIEAWVCLDEDELAMLEKDFELLQYASVNPSPLDKDWNE